MTGPTKHLPTACPSCASKLNVRQLSCIECDTDITGDYPLPRFLTLSLIDQQFITDFVVASGSLKALAKGMEVSYPTVRNRLDDVIQKLTEHHNEKP